MANVKSKIEWTDATWSPTTGCDRVSPGCDHCYALTLAARLKAMGSPAYQRDGDPRTSGPGFGLTTHSDRLDQPIRWTKPRRIFVNSMSDLFHDQVPDEFIVEVFARMWWSPQHIFQVLTKRHGRMRSLVPRIEEHLRRRESDLKLIDCPTPLTWPLPNLHLGVSVEDQQRAHVRLPALMQTPAAVRWLSCEPLLGPLMLEPWLAGIDLTDGTLRDPIDWIVCGGESGPGHRPMHLGWLEAIAAQAADAGVPLFVKQDSGPTSGRQGRIPDVLWARKEYPRETVATDA